MSFSCQTLSIFIATKIGKKATLSLIWFTWVKNNSGVTERRDCAPRKEIHLSDRSLWWNWYQFAQILSSFKIFWSPIKKSHHDHQVCVNCRCGKAEHAVSEDSDHGDHFVGKIFDRSLFNFVQLCSEPGDHSVREIFDRLASEIGNHTNWSIEYQREIFIKF